MRKANHFQVGKGTWGSHNLKYLILHSSAFTPKFQQQYSTLNLEKIQKGLQ